MAARTGFLSLVVLTLMGLMAYLAFPSHHHAHTVLKRAPEMAIVEEIRHMADFTQDKIVVEKRDDTNGTVSTESSSWSSVNWGSSSSTESSFVASVEPSSSYVYLAPSSSSTTPASSSASSIYVEPSTSSTVVSSTSSSSSTFSETPTTSSSSLSSSTSLSSSSSSSSSLSTTTTTSSSSSSSTDGTTTSVHDGTTIIINHTTTITSAVPDTTSTSTTNTLTTATPTLANVSPSSGSGLSKHNRNIIIGCVVGLGVPLLLLFVVLAYYRLFRNKGKSFINAEGELVGKKHGADAMLDEKYFDETVAEDDTRYDASEDTMVQNGAAYKGMPNSATNF